MTLHRVDFSYLLPEWSTIDLDIDEHLDPEEKKEIILAEIKDLYPDVEQIDIEEITVG